MFQLFYFLSRYFCSKYNVSYMDSSYCDFSQRVAILPHCRYLFYVVTCTESIKSGLVEVIKSSIIVLHIFKMKVVLWNEFLHLVFVNSSD